MAEQRIVQKSEVGLVRTSHCRVVRTRERRIWLVPDCHDQDADDSIHAGVR